MGLRKEKVDISSLADDDIVSLIQDNLTPDLLKSKFRGKSENRLWGHCYVASETFYHLRGGKELYQVKRMKVGKVNHWFLLRKEDEEIVDITSGQFDFELDYSTAINAVFLTKNASKRAKVLIERVESWILAETGNRWRNGAFQ